MSRRRNLLAQKKQNRRELKERVQRYSSFYVPWVLKLLFDTPSYKMRRALERKIVSELKEQSAFSGFRSEELYRLYHDEFTRIRYEELKELVTTYIPKDIWMKHKLLPWYNQRRSEFADPFKVQFQFRRPWETTEDAVRYYFESARDLGLAELSLLLVTERRLHESRAGHSWSERGRTMLDRAEIFLHLAMEKHIQSAPQGATTLISQHACEGEHRTRRILEPDGSVFFQKEEADTACQDYQLGPLYKVVLCAKVYPENYDRHTADVSVSSPPENFPEMQIPVYIAVRRKGIIQTIAKALYMEQALGGPLPLHVPDRIGMRILFRNKEEWEIGSRFAMNDICHGAMRKIRTPGGIINAFSYEGLTLSKDGSIIRAQEIEVQCMPIEDHANIIWSYGEEQYLRYHLRWYTDAERGILPRLFPFELYGINWQDAEIQSQLHEHVLTHGRKTSG